MIDPTARALRLLVLLQRRRWWQGADLSRELGVSDRTLRRDVDRLRNLGYRIDSVPGITGGYRLDAGGLLPSLPLGDDEAVVLALGLTGAATSGSDGDEVLLALRARLRQNLPARVRERVTAIDARTTVLSAARPPASAEALSLLAVLCHEHERVRFRYTDRGGTSSSRRVEPQGIVFDGGRWKLVGWDLDREDWRTFRVDRLTDPTRTGVRFSPRMLPAGDAADFVRKAERSLRSTFTATVHLDASADETRMRLGEWGSSVEERAGGGADWRISGATVSELLMALTWIPSEIPWTISASPEVLARVAAFCGRLGEALAGAGSPMRGTDTGAERS